MKNIAALIKNAHSVILSTHRQCDGDGLGAELAIYHALKKIKKNVRMVHVDEVPKKYAFLNADKLIEIYSPDQQLPPTADLCLIFDTNDSRLLGSLFPVLQKHCQTIAFVDHHPELLAGPSPGKDSWINTAAASTGEMAYQLITDLEIPLDANIAKCLYTSITFDTQLYRFVRNSPVSHQIAAQLLEFPIEPMEVHRFLFGNQTVKKIAFLAKTLSQIEYFAHGKIAFLKINDVDLFKYDLESEDSRDVIDMIMNIEGLEAAVLIREDDKNEYKVSFRSKGKLSVLPVAESLGGGGHQFSAGAYCQGSFEEIKTDILDKLTQRL